MKINELFTKDLSRYIKGVVIADELDDPVVWQELDEYVVTKELNGHFQGFINTYLSGIDNLSDITARSNIGIWISGFFGSGKSHFLKIISYLLEQKSVTDPVSGEERTAIQFFENKFGDRMLFADLQRIAGIEADVILFNIDAKADSKESRDVLLNVFLRVFNEMLGFNGDYPHIADLERHLVNKDVYDTFQHEFKQSSGGDWINNRDAYTFFEDHIVKALKASLGMSEEAARNAVKRFNEPYKINIEGFAEKVNDYLKTKSDQHRIIFLVDEVGQFVGQDGHLMLNLQTITEELGTKCNGRAWLIVTSQEDIDAVLGDVRHIKPHDFSKIQGRFKTRLSLSSSNTDEVIQLRLLEKTPDAVSELGRMYDREVELIKHQIRFDSSAPALKTVRSKEEFIDAYPFIPYQFQLIQDVFEAIRKVGASGLHLSRGERSMLNAFQDAAQINQEKEIGTLVPLYDFYPSIESFLDTAVKRTIDQAWDNPNLDKPFDINLLQLLFLIRYTEKRIKGTVENIVTLCIDEISADRIALREKVEAGLNKLEKENLIARYGDVWFFLTNEERDVIREIKNVSVSGSEKARQMAEWIFESVFNGQSKLRYEVNLTDYTFNRICDGHVHGKQSDTELTVELITPLYAEYENYREPQCVLRSSDGRLFIKLPDNADLHKEVQKFIQTEKFISKKADASAPDSYRRILNEQAEQNRQAGKSIIELLEKMVLEAECYAMGQRLEENKRTSAAKLLEQGVIYLIENTYTKLAYIEHPNREATKEIRAVLMSDDVSQPDLVDKPEFNPKAINEIRGDLKHRLMNERILLSEFVERYKKSPFGWPEWEIVLIIARLYKAEEITLIIDGFSLPARDAAEALTKTAQRQKIGIVARKRSGDEDLAQAKKLGQRLFGKVGPDGEENLCKFLKDNLESWRNDLIKFQGIGEGRNYPGSAEITHCLDLINKQLHLPDNFEFISEFNKHNDELAALGEKYNDLSDFYNHQRPVWEQLVKSMEKDFSPNRQLLEQDEKVKEALARMDEILSSDSPYGLLKEVNPLISTVGKYTEAIIKDKRERVFAAIKVIEDWLRSEYKSQDFSKEFAAQIVPEFDKLRAEIKAETSIPQMEFIENQGLKRIEKHAFSLLEKLERKRAEDEGRKSLIKPVIEINTRELWQGRLIETEKDIEEYLKALREKLTEALKDNKRVRIQ